MGASCLGGDPGGAGRLGGRPADRGQQASLAEAAPLGGLARTQSFAGLGRLLGALLLGLLLLVATVAPLLPAALGALLAMARGASLPAWERPREIMTAPLPRMLVTPVVVQAATGAAQIGLAPLLADRLAAGPEASSGYAGLCLAAANLGLLATHRWITARLQPATLPAARRLWAEQPSRSEGVPRTRAFG